MDQVPTGIQSPNEAQTPSGVRSSNETSATPEPLSLSDFRTPLGEPMDQTSASSLAEDPIKWHMNYWNSLWSVAVANGEDGILMALRIEYEIPKIPDKEILNKVNSFWHERQGLIEGEGQRRLSSTSDSFRPQKDTIQSEEQKRMSRDIERMLVDKGRKIRTYLLSLEKLMYQCFEARNYPIPCERREKLRDLYHQIRKRLRVLYQRLNEEEKAEARLEKEKQTLLDPADITLEDICRLLSDPLEDQGPRCLRRKVLDLEGTGRLIDSGKCLWSHLGCVDSFYSLLDEE